MKSIKPGRGPSGMSFVGSICVTIFGVFWTIMAFSITSESPFGIGAIFPLFGVIFVIMGIVQAVYNYKNATGEDRYSIYHITDSNEEGDPADAWIHRKNTADEQNNHNYENNQYKNNYENGEMNFCPYCGTEVESDYSICPKCGKTIN